MWVRIKDGCANDNSLVDDEHCAQRTNTGSVSQPRTVEVEAILMLS